jgi:2'-5' RNA ligase
MNLAALTDQLAAALNIKRSARPYLPHLTLGYLKKHADVS